MESFGKKTSEYADRQPTWIERTVNLKTAKPPDIFS
jgi:hypothetical protein